MDINYNTARIKAMEAYNSLALKLNNHIVNDDLDGDQVIISTQEIDKNLNDLRMMLILIACSYDENNPGFKDVSGAIEAIETFNK